MASARPAPICAVSIDVDPIPCYYRIHGLGAAPPELRELLARRGIAATFFVVAQDIDGAALGETARAARARYGELVRAGHELGSHSYSHPYDLARWPAASARGEIARAHDLVGELAGEVRGFRAPGYDLSPAM